MSNRLKATDLIVSRIKLFLFMHLNKRKYELNQNHCTFNRESAIYDITLLVSGTPRGR